MREVVAVVPKLARPCSTCIAHFALVSEWIVAASAILSKRPALDIGLATLDALPITHGVDGPRGRSSTAEVQSEFRSSL